MLRIMRAVVFVLTIVAAIGWMAGAVHAGTIIKLDLGTDAAPDIRFDGTTLSTMNDGNAGTTGDQDTDANFQDFLSSFPDVLTPTASFSLSGLTPSGAATTLGPLVIQNFNGGAFELYDPANTLLLSGTLTTSALTGPIGAPATGALFTTSVSSVSGGQLASLIVGNSLSLSMSFTDVNGGAGFSVGGATAPMLNPFTADSTLNIAGEPIPEPTMIALIAIGGVLASLAMPRCGRRPVRSRLAPA
jgi:hypothetical protein